MARESERSGTRMGWRAVLIFGARRDPADRLAGLPLAARAAGEAVAAGASEIWLVLERGDLPDSLRSEMERICEGARFRLVAARDQRAQLAPVGYPPTVRLFCD